MTEKEGLFCGRPCPACGASGHFPRFLVDGYRVVKCNRCSLVYLHNPPDEETLYEEYHRIPSPMATEYTAHSNNAALAEIYAINQQRIRALQLIRPRGRLLDVGCGRGYFLKTAQESGFRAMGIDLADAAVQFARQTLGVDAVRLDANEILRSGEVFDIITGWHVVEHFLDPLRVLRLLRQLLSENGICFFEVPNLRSLKFTLSRNKWIGGNHPLYHRTFFTHHTLKKMLFDAQFSKVQRVRLSYDVPGRSAAYEAAKGILNRFALDAFLDFVAYK